MHEAPVWEARRWSAPAPGSPDDWRFERAEVAPPGPGEITIRVRAAGVNPADAKHVAREMGQAWPVAIGYEVAGEVLAVGPDTQLASGPVAVGERVLAFRVQGGYADVLTVAASTVLRTPPSLTDPEAANLLPAGTTAAEMIAVTRADEGEVVLLHGASGAVGVSALQQAARRGIRVIGTASPSRFDVARRFGGEPIAYGDGLADRVRQAAGGAPIAAAWDAVGTDEAVDVSLAVVADRTRIVTIANAHRAETDGIVWIRGSLPASARFRDEARAGLVALAGSGALAVPVARTYPLADAPEALSFLAEGHPGGKIALVP